MAKKKQIELTIEEKLQNALVPKEEQPYKIPNNWCWTYIHNIAIVVTGKTPSKKNKEYYGGKFPFFKPADLDAGRNMQYATEYLSEKGKSISVIIPEKATGICCIGTIGKCGYFLVEGTTNQQINTVISKINPLYSYYFFNTNSFVRELISKASATTIAIVNKSKLESCLFPVAPLNEQQRIVNRIESLFAKIDRAKELIENTLAQFEQNKMAILHKAFIGELTAKWRKEKGILKDTWKSMALENCGTWSGGGTPSMSCGDYWENGNIPWITSKDMKNIYIEKTQKYITEKGVECSSAKYIDKPAILFVTRSGILRRIFPVCMVKIPFTVNQDLKVLVPSKMVCLEYLYWICIYKSNKILGTCMKSGTTVESISTDKLKKFKITVPTIEEQQEIVNILDNLLAKYNKIKNLEQQLEKIELLKKAILAKAFRGELGTNNPDEESAENLLKEILAEK